MTVFKATLISEVDSISEWSKKMLSRKLHKELTDEKVGHESKFKVSLTNVSCQSNHTVEELSFRYQIS